jgi:hypothetical protein
MRCDENHARSVAYGYVLCTADRLTGPNIVALIRRPSSHSSGDRLVDSDSDKTCEFSARKTCVEKRLGISDEIGRFLISRGDFASRRLFDNGISTAATLAWLLTHRRSCARQSTPKNLASRPPSAAPHGYAALFACSLRNRTRDICMELASGPTQIR